MPRRLPALRLPVLAAGLLAASACDDRPSGGLGLPAPAALAIVPTSSSILGGPVFELAGMRVSLRHYPADTPVLDTVLSFDPVSGSAQLAVVVAMFRPSEEFVLRVAAADLLGDTLFRSTDTITLRQHETVPKPTTVILKYSGPDTLVAAISIAPRDTVIAIGVPLVMRPVAFGADQRVLESVRYGWRSSDPTAITVAPDGTVLALDPAQGVWIVARTATGVADSTLISAEPLVASLLVTPDTATVDVAGTVQLSAVALDLLGNPVSLPAAILWSSADEKIALVSPTGLVTGVSPGTVTIGAVSGTVSGTMRVTVAQPLAAQ